MPERLRGENLFYSFDVGFLHVMVYNTGALCCSQEGGDRRAKGLAGVRRPLLLLLSKGRRTYACCCVSCCSGRASEGAAAPG